ncbi:hypothetical protein FGG08_005384 [Glutinoglossum americanum]|uniref:Uncharacterized protein n=1 Tax=Glutinoglossum americanum TaxID=1670608 RepID=A0A9P8HUN6_9PEZI|nr:hypothetical protein FGG08_005384 [Glutinoglossum americanum]
MTQLQKAITSNQPHTEWKNLTSRDCLERYHSGTFDEFSNVIVVTNWTTPSDINNSALGLTILAGQAGRKHSSRQSLVSLCPPSFFSSFNLTEPKARKFVAKGANGLCDLYVPKKFDVKQHNVFVKYCLSQEAKKTCRLLYSPYTIWPWYLAGVFSMQLKDRYILTSPPSAAVVPQADPSSHWFGGFFENIIQKQLIDSWHSEIPSELTLFYEVLIIILLIIGFTAPFVLGFVSKAGIFEASIKGR